MELVNMTPFAGQLLVTSNGRGKEILVVVCKASFSVARGVHLLDKQLPIQPVDSFNGPPEASSIKDFSDLVPEKPNVDVVLQGSAVPRRQGETEVEVRCRFGHHWEKTIQVFGKRQWKSNGFFLAPSSPEPIQKIPLQYEFAFGGADLSNPDRPAGFAMNPVGRGFAGRYSTKNFTDEPVPNLVLLGESMQAPTNHAKVAGFGWIAGHWQPRMTYAGTYDDNWLKNDMPHLPRDFDARYFNAAPEDQQIQGDLTGDEVVEVQNVGPHGALTFELPKVDIVVSVCLGEDLIERPMRCDTVIVNADHATLSMVWRASFDVHQQVAKLHWCSLEQAGGQ